MIVALCLAVTALIGSLRCNVTARCIYYIFSSHLRNHAFQYSSGLARDTVVISPHDKRIGCIRSYDRISCLLLQRKYIVPVLEKGHCLTGHLERQSVMLVARKKLVRDRMP